MWLQKVNFKEMQAVARVNIYLPALPWDLHAYSTLKYISEFPPLSSPYFLLCSTVTFTTTYSRFNFFACFLSRCCINSVHFVAAATNCAFTPECRSLKVQSQFNLKLELKTVNVRYVVRTFTKNISSPIVDLRKILSFKLLLNFGNLT